MRKSRFYQISGNFRSGILSPAAQDDITREDWLNGAAEISNFDILRDGGIRTRPRLVSAGFGLPRLRRSILAGTTPAIGGGLHFSSNPAIADASPIELNRNPFLNVRFSTERNNVRAVVFEGVRLRQGPWNVNGELVFAAEVTSDPTPTSDADWTRIGSGEDPYRQYGFVPGRVRRDVVVQIPRDEGSEYRNLRQMRLRVKIDPDSDNGRELALRTLELLIDRVKVYDRRAPDTPADAIPADDFGYRIVPWVLRSFDMALVIAQDAMLVVGAPRTDDPWEPKRIVSPDPAWAFTRKQLRELTWCAYGSHLLLFHSDFPRPLEVRLSGVGQIAVSYLPMENTPQLPARLDAEARLDVRQVGEELVLDQPEPATGAATRAIVPANIIGVAQVNAARLVWADVGASRYQVLYQTESDYAGRTGDLWPSGDLNITTETVTVPRATVTGLLGGTAYRFAIVSVVDAGPNALAGETDPADADDIVLTVLRAALGAASISVGTDAETDGLMLVSWSAVTDTQAWKLKVTTNNGASWRVVSDTIPGGTTRYRYAGTPGVSYGFRVTATSTVAPDGPVSNEAYATAVRIGPAGPSGPLWDADPNVNGRITFNWGPGARAESYDLQIASDAPRSRYAAPPASSPPDAPADPPAPNARPSLSRRCRAAPHGQSAHPQSP